MAFPTSPTNGQQAVVGNITYQYASATNSWARVPGIANNISASGNITASYFIGNGSLLTGLATTLSGNLQGNLEGNGYGANAFSFVSVTGNITGSNAYITGNLTSGTVTYANTDGTSGQVLATYGNGQTYFQTLSSTGGIYLRVYVRSGGYVNVTNYQGFITVVGRTGNIAIPITP